jgi:hypothetical protein
MRLPPVPAPAKIAARVGLPGAAAVGTWLAILKAAPKTPDLIVIGAVMAVVAIAGVTPMIVESISKRLPAIIRAWNEARDQHHRRKMQSELLRAVAGGNENAKEALRMQAISPDLPPGRRLSDDVLKQQWALPKNPLKKPVSGTPPDGAEVFDFPRKPPGIPGTPGQPPALTGSARPASVQGSARPTGARVRR